MDPLVRLTLTLQRAGARASGSALALGSAAYLVWWAAEPPPLLLTYAVALVAVASTALRVVRRLRSIAPEGTAVLDVELYTHLLVLCYAAVLYLPGGLNGPFHPTVYVLLMLAAAFSRPAAALGTAAFAIALEVALQMLASPNPDIARLWTHCALAVVFTTVNMVVFRAEIARIRRLSRKRIDTELQKMRDAARSYRLLGAPSTERQGAGDDEDRLVRSGVDEIHQAVKFALDVLRRGLGLRTAVLLGLDSQGNLLNILELSTDEDAIEPGPFNARDGIFAAALSKGEAISLHGPRAAVHAHYYALPPNVGAIAAIPVMEHAVARGVLVVDREAREPFSASEEQTLRDATCFFVRAIENERIFVQLERAKSEQGKLYRSAERLASATTEAQVIEAGVNSAREFTSFDFAVVTLFHRSAGEHEICAVSGDGAEELVGQRFRHNSGLVSMVVANRHALPYRGDYDAERQVVFTRRLRPPPLPSLLVLPLVVHDRALGTLVLGSERPHAFGDAVRPTLEVLASHVAVSLANARMLKRLEEMATTDGLTGLFNKRALTELAEQKLRSAQRFGKALSVLVCDIDHFKRVNDTYGHDVGDVVIRGLGVLLQRVKRDTDIVGRFGGEEFVAVCEQTDAEGAALLAERIRSELESTKFMTELGELSVTCSIGVSTFPAAGEDWQALFKSTDEALYVSKRGGRNQVTVWSSKLQGCAA